MIDSFVTLLLILFIIYHFNKIIQCLYYRYKYREFRNKLSKHPELKIIGLTGLKRSGKDTIANYLSKYYGYERIAFADPLKYACIELFGFNYDQCYESAKEEPDEFWFGLTPRKIFQFIGTELMRNKMSELHPNFGQDFWVLCCEKKIKDILSVQKDTLIVISDVRFPNECEMIKKMGGIVIRVNRDCVDTGEDLHESERLVKELEVDYEIDNNESLEDLWSNIDQLMN